MLKPSEMHRLVLGKNNSYVQSLFLGIFLPILFMPVIVYQVLVKPLYNSALMLFSTFVLLPICALAGRVVIREQTFQERVAESLKRASSMGKDWN